MVNRRHMVVSDYLSDASYEQLRQFPVRPMFDTAYSYMTKNQKSLLNSF